MRSYPTADYELKDLAKLNPEPWMVDQLKLNPSYPHWGPHEDYMWKEKEGWDSRVIHESWDGFGPWSLDDYNEVVNFYFHVGRPAETCSVCGGLCYHPDAQWVSESFYSHSSPFKNRTPSEEAGSRLMQAFGAPDLPGAIPRGTIMPSAELVGRYGQLFMDFCVRTMERGGAWNDDITEDEAAALIEHHRYKAGQTAAEINAEQHGRGIGHDCINRHILIETRLKRLGMPKYCELCDGDGSVYTGPAHLALTLWVIHPRKGASRGVEVNNIRQDQLPDVYEYLHAAAKRNADRFKLVVKANKAAK